MERSDWDKNYYEDRKDLINAKKREKYKQTAVERRAKIRAYEELEALKTKGALELFRKAFPPRECTDYATYKLRDQKIKENLDQIAKDQWGKYKPWEDKEWMSKLSREATM